MICDVVAPAVSGWHTHDAVDAVANVGSRYGPVHVSSVHGRPVVTISGPRTGVAAVSGPVAPATYITGPSGSISTSAHASASASSVASSQGNNYYYKKFFYPAPVAVDC